MTLPTPKLEQKPPDWFEEGFNPRPVIEDDDFERLMDSIKEKGIFQPVGALDSRRMLFGRRRRRAAEKLGLKLVPVLIYPATLSDGEIVAVTMQENLLRKDLTYYETLVGVKQFKVACPDMAQKDIAKAVGMSEGMLSQFFALDKLCPEAMEAFKAGTLGVTKAYKIVSSPDQLATLGLFLDGETRESVGRKTRRPSNPSAPRASKIKVPLVSGATVTVAGEGVSMDEALEAVHEAAKQIKTAIAKGITAKSAMGYWKDIAAAG